MRFLAIFWSLVSSIDLIFYIVNTKRFQSIPSSSLHSWQIHCYPSQVLESSCLLIAISSGYRKFMGKLYIIGNLFVGWYQYQYREAEYRTSLCYSEHENAFWRNLIFWFNYCLNVHHYRGTKCTLQFSPKEIQGTFNKFQKSPDWLVSSS